MDKKLPRSPLFSLVFIGAATLFSLFLLISLNSIYDNTHKQYTPWIDASMEIKLEVTQAHLWFEEILSGDNSQDFSQVERHLKQAFWYTDAILKGGQNKQGSFRPLSDTKLISEVKQLQQQLILLEQQTQIRYQLGGSASAGSASDIIFDQLFTDITNRTSKLETNLKKHIELEIKARDNLMIMQLIAACIICLISCYGIWRSLNARNHFVNQLAQANKHIHEQNKALQQVAQTDSLTGLPNRQMIERICSQILGRVRRHNHGMSLTFIDIDFFKTINDQYGHRVGDQILTQFTQLVKAELREEDLFGRLAGDEFILVLEAETEEQLRSSLDHILERIYKRLQHPIITNPELHIRISAGTSIAPAHGESTDFLLHSADTAMYQSKTTGRGQHTYFDQLAIPDTDSFLTSP